MQWAVGEDSDDIVAGKGKTKFEFCWRQVVVYRGACLSSSQPSIDLAWLENDKRFCTTKWLTRPNQSNSQGGQFSILKLFNFTQHVPLYFQPSFYGGACHAECYRLFFHERGCSVIWKASWKAGICFQCSLDQNGTHLLQDFYPSIF